MKFISKYTNLTALTSRSGKSGFFTPGEAAQKKLYAAEYIPSSTGWWGLIFPLLPLAHAAVGTLPSFSRLAHSGAVRSWHHLTTGAHKLPQRRATWPTSTSGALRHDSFQAANWLKPYKKEKYGQTEQLCTKEIKPR